MSVFSESIDFLVKLGIYDVVLPFLLVFTIVFAILEKTKILGTEKVKDAEVTKKNLNAMIAFVMAFFVVASTQIVAVINKSLSQIFLVLMLFISFLMLAGSFHQQTKEGFFLDKGPWRSAFMAVTAIAIVAIFLNAVGWLDLFYNYLRDNWNKSYVAAVIFVILIIGFMVFITKDSSKKDDKKD